MSVAVQFFICVLGGWVMGIATTVLIIAVFACPEEEE
jgi:hypothetical protein